MGPVTSSSSSQVSQAYQSPVRNNAQQNQKSEAFKFLREKLDITQPSGSEVARSQSTETRSDSFKLASEEDLRDAAQQGATRRGSVLDLSV